MRMNGQLDSDESSGTEIGRFLCYHMKCLKFLGNVFYVIVPDVFKKVKLPKHGLPLLL